MITQRPGGGRGRKINEAGHRGRGYPPGLRFEILADEMKRLQWRVPYRNRARKARVVGGPNNGLLVPVKEKDGDFVFPDVMDWSSYTFDPEAWEFRYTPSERLGDRLPDR
jgi:hypothetical protein